MEEGWRNFREAFKQSWNKVFRYGCYLVLLEFLLLATGFGIWMIFHGLWLLGSRLVLYWRPARKWFNAKIIKTQDERLLQMPIMDPYRLISVTIYFVGAILMIYLGAKILVQDGFLKQNLIYMVISQ